ncbi:hypothetical protein [Succinimonas amylolytica]|uniref:hypothetical protein n=1 Tax=Succinimonas amylolytica TaxID=83769 RepID=UPI0003763DC1|nr:hypothetical protein [Succinimonas amylolytica]
MTDTSNQNLQLQYIKEAQEISSKMNSSLLIYILSYIFMPLFLLSIPRAYKLAFRAQKLLEAAGNSAASLEAETVYKQQKMKWNILLGLIFGGLGMGILSWILPDTVGYYIAMLYGILSIVSLAYFIFADFSALNKRSPIKAAIDRIGG